MKWLGIPLALASAAAQAEPAAPAAPSAAFEAGLMSAVLRVSDAPRVAAFYETVLGMKTAMSRDLGAIHETMLLFGADRAKPGIMLISRATAATPATGAQPLHGQGASRLILRVSDLDEVVRRLDAAHIAHGPVRGVERGIRVLQIDDPEHNELELIQTPQAR